MSVVDRIIQLAKERQARIEAARATLRSLAPDERREVFVDFVAMVEADARAEVDAPPEPTVAPTKIEPPAAEGTFTDKAEAFVLKHPEGVKTSDVSKAIGQKVESVDGTLRSVWKSRKTIERRDGLWFPSPKAPANKRKTHRALIAEVMAAGNRPMGAGDVIAAVQQLDAERKRESLEAELHRMREDRLIAQQGTNGRGSLYVLTNGGQPTITS